MGGLAGRDRFRLGLQKFDGDLGDEAWVARESEHEVDPVLFAPRHQRLAAEAGIGAQENARPRPARPDVRDDARDLLNRSGASVDVRRPELGRQQMPAAEHVQRQIAVTVVVAVEEPALLMAVQRIVGGVEVERDLFGRPDVRLEEEVDEQRFDRRRIMADLLVARRRRPRQLQPVQRRFARDRRAILAPGFELPRQNRHHRIVAEIFVIVQVLIAERDAEHPLPHERGDRMLDEPRVSGVAEASRKPPDQIEPSVGGAQKQSARVRSQRAAVELGDNGPAFDPSKQARFCATLRLHRATFQNRLKSFSQNNFCLIRRSDALHSLRDAG